MVHLGNTSNDIWVSSYNGSSWSTNVRVPNQQSKATPAIVEHNGLLHMVYLGNTSNELWHSTFNGTSWTTNVRIPNQQSKSRPALISYAGRLHMVHQGNTSNDLWYSTFNGTSWSPNMRIAGQASKATPAFAVLGNALYMAHLGNTSNDIWISTLGASGWSPNERLGGAKSKSTPAFATFNGNLCIVHTGDESNDLWLSIFDGNNYTRDIQLTGRSSRTSPAAATLLSRGARAQLHVVHIGESSNDLWHGVIPARPDNAPAAPTFDHITKRSVMVRSQDRSTNEELFVVQYRRGNDPWKENVMEVGGCPPAGTSTDRALSRGVDGFKPGRTYELRVCAINYGGSMCSGARTFTTLSPEIPAKPTDLKITETAAYSVSIAWTDNSSNEDGFKIEYGTRSKTVGKNNTNYNISDLYPNVKYCIKVSAYNEDGGSDATPEKCPTTTQGTTAGFSSINVFNCHTDRKTVRIWIYDKTKNENWEDQGTLASQWSSGGSCPSGQPKTISLTAGHSFDLVAIDCGDAPPPSTNGSCYRISVPSILAKDGGGVKEVRID